MKIWTEEHIFDHPWETVVTAASRKYPNPLNPNVIGVDVVDRKVEKGVLKSHRLMTTEWFLPKWAVSLVGIDRACFASEHSAVDTNNKTLTLKSRNLTFNNILSIDEKLVYCPHPTDPSKTLLRQENEISVSNVPLTGYMESLIQNTMSAQAGKGRLALEHVIDVIKTDTRKGIDTAVNDLSKSVDHILTSNRPTSSL